MQKKRARTSEDLLGFLGGEDFSGFLKCSLCYERTNGYITHGSSRGYLVTLLWSEIRGDARTLNCGQSSASAYALGAHTEMLHFRKWKHQFRFVDIRLLRISSLWAE